MTNRRTIYLLLVGIVLAVVVTLIISFSISAIRDTMWFNRILTRIERDGASDEYLAEAQRYARDRDDWFAILRIAWNLPEERRWRNVAEISNAAAENFSRDGTWRFFAAYASLSDGRFERAQEHLDKIDTHSELSQKVRVLTVLDPNAPEEHVQRLSAFAQRPEEERILTAIGRAFSLRNARAFTDAGEATSVPEFFLTGALVAAEAGDREAAVSIVDRIKKDEVTGNPLTVLYLARWLEDSDWFFNVAATVGGQRATRGDVRLMQAEFLADQRQYAQADRLYQEIIREVPTLSEVPFINRTVIIRKEDSGSVDDIFRLGLEHHPDSVRLRIAYASYLLVEHRRIEAATVLIPIGTLAPGKDVTTQKRWLLTRVVLGPTAPVERLETDLWSYINQEPDAHLVAGFLARFLLYRDDQRGLAILRERYDPQDATWSAAIHGIHGATVENYGDALNWFSIDPSFLGRYNVALFLLRHGTLNEAELAIERAQMLAEQSDDTESIVDTILLSAELARLRENHDESMALIRRARLLSPYDDEVYVYEALLAPEG